VCVCVRSCVPTDAGMTEQHIHDAGMTEQHIQDNPDDFVGLLASIGHDAPYYQDKVTLLERLGHRMTGARRLTVTLLLCITTVTSPLRSSGSGIG